MHQSLLPYLLICLFPTKIAISYFYIKSESGKIFQSDLGYMLAHMSLPFLVSVKVLYFSGSDSMTLRPYAHWLAVCDKSVKQELNHATERQKYTIFVLRN